MCGSSAGAEAVPLVAAKAEIGGAVEVVEEEEEEEVGTELAVGDRLVCVWFAVCVHDGGLGRTGQVRTGHSQVCGRQLIQTGRVTFRRLHI